MSYFSISNGIFKTTCQKSIQGEGRSKKEKVRI